MQCLKLVALNVEQIMAPQMIHLTRKKTFMVASIIGQSRIVLIEYDFGSNMVIAQKQIECGDFISCLLKDD